MGAGDTAGEFNASTGIDTLGALDEGGSEVLGPGGKGLVVRDSAVSAAGELIDGVLVAGSGGLAVMDGEL